MEVIPAIDLLGGRCVRLYQGDRAQAQTYGEDPVAVARQWVEAGATRLHTVDLDGAERGHPVNQDAIAAIARAVAVPVQVGGGLRDRDSVARLLEAGAVRAILGTAAIEQPGVVCALCQAFPGQIAASIDARNGRVAAHGWLETTEVSAIKLAQQLQALGVAAIVYTDIQRDGTLSGPNLEALRALAAAIEVPAIASGGVSSVADLLDLAALEPLGLSGAIVGRALYTGDVSLPEALQAVGPGRWQDVPADTEPPAWA
ncbi:MAG: 1-(5-phosphoribosyl)-5-[(5-phosphoribosylamino)methylideneamino]imidazole-4-carboxamide isomerase [Cyanobacteria bacterium QS_8_64_29]|nr:MAG: 1-(5-phosphoribosyl)-5-[(5-phosphoribosylamino)methylideneamino]imidazole-4-carboxamide isomerase [Cyanobacteria bacterium QS_8_64_29]